MTTAILRLDDKQLAETIEKAHHTDSIHATALSNLVIVELLQRLLEKDRPPKQELTPDLPAKIISTLDLAENLIRSFESWPDDKCRKFATQDNLVLFGMKSQEIRNILSNSEKVGDTNEQ